MNSLSEIMHVEFGCQKNNYKTSYEFKSNLDVTFGDIYIICNNITKITKGCLGIMILHEQQFCHEDVHFLVKY